MVNSLNFELAKAIKQRDDFLKEHPEYLEFQSKIERDMDRFDDPVAKMHVIAHHLRWNNHRLDNIKRDLAKEFGSEPKD